MKMWKAKLLAGLGGLAMASTASAAFYQIQVSGLNLVYSEATGNLCDAASCSIITGFGGAAADADPVFTMNFIKDNALVLSLSDANNVLSVDYFMNLGAGTDPAGVNPTIGFGVVDFLVSSLPGIATNISSGAVTFSNGGLNANGAGFSTVFSQNLPNNPAALGADWVGFNPINWSFSSGGAGTCTGAVGAQVCTYAGTGELSWSSAVPEPSSLLLLGLGLAGAGFFGRKRVSA